LNNVKQQKRDEIEMEPWSHGAVDAQYRAWLKEMDRHWRTGGEIAGGNLTLGYVTEDVRVPSRARSNMFITSPNSHALVLVTIPCTRQYPSTDLHTTLARRTRT